MLKRKTKKSMDLKRKVVAALMGINMLQTTAPVLNVIVNTAPSGHVGIMAGEETPANILDSAMYGTAAAASITQAAKEGETVFAESMEAGDRQIISSGGTGSICLLHGGTQSIASRGRGTVSVMTDGWQCIEGIGRVEVLSGGTQYMHRRIGQYDEGTGSVGIMEGGTQWLYDNYVEGTVDDMRGGLIYATGVRNTVRVTKQSGGCIDLKGMTKVDANITVKGLMWVSAAMMPGSKVTVASGGQQRLDSGGVAVGTTIESGGFQGLYPYSEAVDTTVKKGGTMEIYGLSTVTRGNIDGGTMNVYGVMKPESTVTVHNGGVQHVFNKATGTTVGAGGCQYIDQYINKCGYKSDSGGLAVGTRIEAGGTQIVSSGCKAEDSIISGGRQDILPGGVASGSLIKGSGVQAVSEGGFAADNSLETSGTVMVGSEGKVHFKAATGGNLYLEGTGAAATFGDKARADYRLTHLWADLYTGHGADTAIILGKGDKAASSVAGNTLTIDTMAGGGAAFRINTDLANNKSDQIIIKNVDTGTHLKNTIQVNYDPGAKEGKPLESSSPDGTLVATVNSGDATFKGAESDIGGYKYTPEIIRKANGTKTEWRIKGLATAGNSKAMDTMVANGDQMLGYWRISNEVSHKRMQKLRRGAEIGLWADMTRGKLTLGSSESGTYNRYTVGYDKKLDKQWIAGAAFTYQKGSESYAGGRGQSDLGYLSAYGLWQDDLDNFLQLDARLGQGVSDFSTMGRGSRGLIHTKDRISRWGYGLGAVYGHKFRVDAQNTLTPYAGISWSRLQGRCFHLSDGSAAQIYASDSVLGRLGAEWQLDLKGKGSLYAGAAFVHDFAGNGMSSITHGLTNTVTHRLRDNWMEFNIGYQYTVGATTLWAQTGLRTGAEASKDWQYSIGASISF